MLPLVALLIGAATVAALASGSSGGKAPLAAKGDTLVFKPAPTASAARWMALAKANANLVKQWGSNAPDVMLERPGANSETQADIVTWLQKWKSPLLSYGMSPVFAYPEMGWKFSGDTATAGYSLGAGNDAHWTATSDGNFHYDHEENLTQEDLTAALGDLTQFLKDLEVAVPLAIDLGGFLWVGMFLHVVEALANGKTSLTQLGQALKQDWDVSSNAAQLGFAVFTGDWGKAWDRATDYGADLEGVAAAFSPGAAPDRNGDLTIQPGTVVPPKIGATIDKAL